MSQMMIQPGSRNIDVLLPKNITDKNRRSHLITFCDWLDLTGRSWHTPALDAYRDYLLHEKEPAPLKPTSAKAHLSTIRAQYRRLLADNDFRFWMYHVLSPDQPLSPADRKALVDEFVLRLTNATAPTVGEVKVTTIQDEADADQLRLTNHQAYQLMRRPGMTTQRGIRDTAMIAFLLCTGIREAELCNLEVDDLYQHYSGKPAVVVRQGKGAKQRMVPYGVMGWVVGVVEHWLQVADIQDGHVFRGFYKGNRRIRAGRLSERSVERTLREYPIQSGMLMITATPHALRRTYARACYMSGMTVEAIAQNLGHSDTRTTMHYIGNIAGELREPDDLYRLDGFNKE